MLPNVLNNLVEAKVSVDRVESFLLESEKELVPEFPLKRAGVMMNKASLVYEGVGRTITLDMNDPDDPRHKLARSDSNRGNTNSVLNIFSSIYDMMPAIRIPFFSSSGTTAASASTASENSIYLTDAQYETVLLKAQLDEANALIDDLVQRQDGLTSHSHPQSISHLNDDKKDDELNDSSIINPIRRNSSNSGVKAISPGYIQRVLALSRVNMSARSHDLLAIVGQVFVLMKFL